ncbi:hypothetical protein H312_02550 [Anncaliia algerae PRA339]|uniref:Uncharacterized protein n=1 Tax=Anncaliia algerae PRA339 TaxID=1288291 RepID=A0A059EZE4_9MICR|nr:hypothetical protein H312_02550 [Anncaliia algerae PRA339]
MGFFLFQLVTILNILKIIVYKQNIVTGPKTMNKSYESKYFIKNIMKVTSAQGRYPWVVTQLKRFSSSIHSFPVISILLLLFFPYSIFVYPFLSHLPLQLFRGFKLKSVF